MTKKTIKHDVNYHISIKGMMTCKADPQLDHEVNIEHDAWFISEVDRITSEYIEARKNRWKNNYTFKGTIEVLKTINTVEKMTY